MEDFQYHGSDCDLWPWHSDIWHWCWTSVPNFKKLRLLLFDKLLLPCHGNELTNELTNWHTWLITVHPGRGNKDARLWMLNGTGQCVGCCDVMIYRCISNWLPWLCALLLEIRSTFTGSLYYIWSSSNSFCHFSAQFSTVLFAVINPLLLCHLMNILPLRAAWRASFDAHTRNIPSIWIVIGVKLVLYLCLHSNVPS